MAPSLTLPTPPMHLRPPQLAFLVFFAALVAPGAEAQLRVSVRTETRIAAQSGGFPGTLDPVDRFGEALAGLGDVDGDGVADVAAGAPTDDLGGINHGVVHLLLLNADGSVKSEREIGEGAGGFPFALDDGSCFGGALANLGDLDGDGIAELAVGARDQDGLGTSRGVVFVLFLAADGSVRAATAIGEGAGGFAGSLEDFDNFGASVASVGDLDGDGIRELAVGAIGDDDGGGNAGAVYVLFLDDQGAVKREQKLAPGVGGFVGPLDGGDSFGESVADVGDLDGDGLSELAVGASGDDDGGIAAGAVWILFLDALGNVRAEQKVSATTGGFDGDVGMNDAFGRALCAPGDLDGDGVADLLVGATGDDDGGSRRGAVWVLFLRSTGDVSGFNKISDEAGFFGGTLNDNDGFGWGIALLGDLDGNGEPEVAVGAPQDDEGGFDAGAVWVLFLETGPAFQVDPPGAADSIDTRASIAERNGSGINPDILDGSGPPLLGTTWTGTIDATGFGFGTLTFLVFFGAPLGGVATPFGELLVDPTGGPLYSSTAFALGSSATHSIAVPNLPALAGRAFFGQAAINSIAGLTLTNALDVVLGY